MFFVAILLRQKTHKRTQTYIRNIEFIYANEMSMLLRLHDNRFREYQVLLDRTHPFMSMEQLGGYILSGVKIQSQKYDNYISNIQTQQTQTQKQNYNSNTENITTQQETQTQKKGKQ